MNSTFLNLNTLVYSRKTTNKHVRSGNSHNIYWAQDIRRSCEASFKTYKHLLHVGIPKELARGVLPMNTYTRFFGSVNLHNLFHFIELRIAPHAQYEIQQYGRALIALIEPIVPLAYKAFTTIRIKT